LRLNFAQVCIYCGVRWCQSAQCIAQYEASSWGVCPTCEGGAMDEEVDPDEEDLLALFTSCVCAYGVVAL
jgi:hypothetical protein